MCQIKAFRIKHYHHATIRYDPRTLVKQLPITKILRGKGSELLCIIQNNHTPALHTLVLCFADLTVPTVPTS